MTEDISQKSMIRNYFAVNSNYNADEVGVWNEHHLKFYSNNFGNLNYDESIIEKDLNHDNMGCIESYNTTETEKSENLSTIKQKPLSSMKASDHFENNDSAWLLNEHGNKGQSDNQKYTNSQLIPTEELSVPMTAIQMRSRPSLEECMSSHQVLEPSRECDQQHKPEHQSHKLHERSPNQRGRKKRNTNRKVRRGFIGRVLCCFTSANEDNQPQKPEYPDLTCFTNGINTEPISTPTNEQANSEFDSGRLSCIDRELPPLPRSQDHYKTTLTQAATKCTGATKPESISSPSSPTSSSKSSSTNQNTENKSPVATTKSSTTPAAVAVNLPTNEVALPDEEPISLVECVGQFTCSICGVVNYDDKLQLLLGNNGQDNFGIMEFISNPDQYDPTYAMIKRKHRCCIGCGSPSLFTTPAHSNRNSCLSLWQLQQQQQNNNSQSMNSTSHNQSSLVNCSQDRQQQLHHRDSKLDLDNQQSDNNSVYAAVDRPPKPHIITRQKSSSQSDLEIINSIKKPSVNMLQNQINDQSNELAPTTTQYNTKYFSNTMSIWSLKDSSCANLVFDSSTSTYQSIPERNYGQSVLDLIENMKTSNYVCANVTGECDNYSFAFNEDCLQRSCTPTILSPKSSKQYNSLWNRSQISLSNSLEVNRVQSICSPLKIMDYSFNGPDQYPPTIQHKSMRTPLLFEPMLSPPPLSPLDTVSVHQPDQSNNITHNNRSHEDNNAQNALEKDVDNNKEDKIDVYEDLLSSASSDSEEEPLDTVKSTNHKSLIKPSNENSFQRTRPVSIGLHGDEVYLANKSMQHRMNRLLLPSLNLTMSNCINLIVLANQMSPLMEQSILLDDCLVGSAGSGGGGGSGSCGLSTSNHMSSAGSCAKSPLSNQNSPRCGDVGGIVADKPMVANRNGYNINSNSNCVGITNGFNWSSSLDNLNCVFDDYEILE